MTYFAIFRIFSHRFKGSQAHCSALCERCRGSDLGVPFRVVASFSVLSGVRPEKTRRSISTHGRGVRMEGLRHLCNKHFRHFSAVKWCCNTVLVRVAPQAHFSLAVGYCDDLTYSVFILLQLLSCGHTLSTLLIPFYLTLSQATRVLVEWRGKWRSPGRDQSAQKSALYSSMIARKSWFMDPPGSVYVPERLIVWSFRGWSRSPAACWGSLQRVRKVLENPTNVCDFSVITDHHVDAVDTGETHREDRQEKDQKDSEDQIERWPERQP